eukprot:Lithocolla_globosa_v1_NODE_199_length_5224_cov_8.409618.p7 type:complete len:113 gc:universal NODE_199_length_5224_cov_8.409618:2497-2835(+)
MACSRAFLCVLAFTLPAVFTICSVGTMGLGSPLSFFRTVTLPPLVKHEIDRGTWFRKINSAIEARACPPRWSATYKSNSSRMRDSPPAHPKVPFFKAFKKLSVSTLISLAFE